MLTVCEWRRLKEKYFIEMKAKRSRKMLFVNVAEVVLYFEEKVNAFPYSLLKQLFHAIKIEELSLERQLSLVLVLEILGFKFNLALPHKNAGMVAGTCYPRGVKAERSIWLTGHQHFLTQNKMHVKQNNKITNKTATVK